MKKTLAGLTIFIISCILMLMQVPLFNCSLQVPPNQSKGRIIHSFDYTATTECLNEPLAAQYGGGVILNPNLDQGLKGWTLFGNGVMEERKSINGNKFIAVHSRKSPWDSFSQRVQLKKGYHYALSAWVQVSEGTETIALKFKIPRGVGYVHGGTVVAKHGCWSMLKGGFISDLTTPAKILFEVNNTATEVWVDNISLQSFTSKQWRYHQLKSISKLRKTKLSFKVSDVKNANATLGGAKVTITQKKTNFPFGCSMSKNIIGNSAYQNWFAQRFKYTTFQNEMKWYDNEANQGKENYGNPDAMLDFTKQHGISVRGHNVFWEDPQYQQYWIRSLNADQLRAATDKRINSVMSRYKGQVIAWDVVNENLHFKFYEDKLGATFSADSYAKAHQIDSGVTLFMNEYNTVEESRDQTALPQNYINKLKELQGKAGVTIGIGLQAHFSQGQPNIPYMRATLDTLAATGSPIWLTEVDTAEGQNQAQYLEQVLMEGYSHPAVKGIIMWAGPAVDKYRMPLTDENYNSNANGAVVDKLIQQWKSANMELAADDNGCIEVSLFHGDYDVTVVHPETNFSTIRSIKAESHLSSKNSHFHILV